MNEYQIELSVGWCPIQRIYPIRRYDILAEFDSFRQLTSFPDFCGFIKEFSGPLRSSNIFLVTKKKSPHKTRGSKKKLFMGVVADGDIACVLNSRRSVATPAKIPDSAPVRFIFFTLKVEHLSPMGIRHQSIPIRLSLCRTCQLKTIFLLLFVGLVSYYIRVLPVCRRTSRGGCWYRSVASSTSVTSRRESRDRYTKEHFYSRALGLFGLDER